MRERPITEAQVVEQFMESTNDNPSFNRHISQIHTDPLVVRWLTADQSDLGEDLVTTAQRRFFDRYCNPVYAFVRKMLSDVNATDDVVQQFAVRVMEKSFRSYNPERGRFRDYLKMTLRNMVTDYWRGVQRSRRFSGEQFEDRLLEVPDPTSIDDAISVQEGELESLLERSFERLRAIPQTARPTFYEVLIHVTRNPDQSSETAATALSLDLNLSKPINGASLRQTLRRARERFQELLLEELKIPDGPKRKERVQERLEALGIREFFKSE